MRPRFLLPALILAFVPALAPRLDAYYVTYKEQYYRLYHLHYIQYPDDSIENIYWLEKALAADFCNPLWALTKIENEIQWEKYRYLFMMHINLKLIEQHLLLGNKWNKRNAYFYNAPWRDQNLESLETAETCYRAALSYWNDAVAWAEKARENRFRFINVENVQYWEDEAYRILDEKTLDYEKVITRELNRLQQVRERFEAMDENTY
jgi:hypothetical protein